MKVNDFVHRYTFNSVHKRDGICRLRTFVNSENKSFILLTELDNNTSASITNSIEDIAKEITELGIANSTATIIEHHEYNNSFNIVNLIDYIPSLTTWTDIDITDVLRILETDTEEFSLQSNDRKRIINTSEKISTSIDQSRNLNNYNSNDYVARELEIDKNKISKIEILDLINSSPNERIIQSFLKNDLSIFAEFYAHPPDQYICFSEFPIGNGFVDYVVFTGISRMDVILIEVKGANFNVITKGHYKKTSSEIEKAFQQIKNHLSYIHKDYDSFREEMHRIREKIEKGETLYNSFIGPDKILQVDPNKDINISSVIIGGTTTDDYEESRIRNAFELNSFNIKLESWNSWARKIQRK